MESTLNKVRFSRQEGEIEIAPTTSGRFCVTLLPRNPNLFLPRRTCETTFPLELIRFLFEKMDYAWLCDSMARHEDPAYVMTVIRRQLFSYLAHSAFSDKRLLDFGCGSGSSSFAIAAMLPETEVVGVELNENLVEVARRIAEFRGLPNVRFLQSPNAESLPPNMGTFDFVMLCAVYEHLLPKERKNLMPKLWSATKAGGIIFVSQTPQRYFPYEHHSTKLWLINYLPDGLAYSFARKFARRKLPNRPAEWEELLRGGIRGGTERSIVRDLCQGDSKAARILQPHQNGLRDRADYWLSCTDASRHRRIKRSLASLFRLSDRFLGVVPSMNVDVAIRKEYRSPRIRGLQTVRSGVSFPRGRDANEAAMPQRQEEVT